MTRLFLIFTLFITQVCAAAAEAGPVPASPVPSETKAAAVSGKKAETPQLTMVPLSGMVLMPTAFKGTGENSIGVGLDINAAYFIGRLYGKNSYSWTTEKKDYLDQIGIWMLSGEGKMQIQTEKNWRPAVAVGGQGILTFRDTSQSASTFELKSDSSDNANYANAFIAASKHIGSKLILTAGYSEGDMPKLINDLSEYLSETAMENSGYTNPSVPSQLFYGGLIWLPKPTSPIMLEILVPNGAPMHPKLVNLHLGTLLKLNFELSYLKFDGGWDLIGMFQFRYNYFPRSN